MRVNRIILCALLATLIGGTAQAQTAIQLTPASQVGLGPEGIATDGTSVFVANQFSDTVSKLRASDGAVVGTYAVGHRPVAVAFDGAFFWVANYLSNNVMKLDASGAVVATFATGDGPGGLLATNGNVWVANRNANTLTKLRASFSASSFSPTMRCRWAEYPDFKASDFLNCGNADFGSPAATN